MRWLDIGAAEQNRCRGSEQCGYDKRCECGAMPEPHAEQADQDSQNSDRLNTHHATSTMLQSVPRSSHPLMPTPTRRGASPSIFGWIDGSLRRTATANADDGRCPGRAKPCAVLPSCAP